jgi:hypothetical protein
MVILVGIQNPLLLKAGGFLLNAPTIKCICVNTATLNLSELSTNTQSI